MTKFIRKPEVLARTGRSQSRLYADVKQGCFPKPVKIGANSVAWLEDEVEKWMAERIAERDGQAA